MKYLRTKNGVIYEIIRETKTSFELRSSFDKKMGCKCVMIKRIFGSDIEPTYRKADTIEELCDEFRIVEEGTNFRGEPHIRRYQCSLGKENGVTTIITYFDFEDEYKLRNEMPYTYYTKKNTNPIYKIYGAIWTEWGLKYVAKMNSKGKFELL